jgi:translation initiation factor 3 subunit D
MNFSPGESYGTLNYYDKNIDKVNVKQPISLDRFPGGAYNLSTTEDQIIQKLAKADTGNVFATDMILATLMAASRSVESWDIVAYRIGNKLFFDKRSTSGVSPIGSFHF